MTQIQMSCEPSLDKVRSPLEQVAPDGRSAKSGMTLDLVVQFFEI